MGINDLRSIITDNTWATQVRLMNLDAVFTELY